jgi:protein TonB
MQSIEEEPATDAPRAANDEKVERKTPDKETNTPPAPTPTTEQNPGGPAGKESTETARQEAPQAAQTSWARSDDKPDAEVVSAVESELQKAEQEARAEPQPQPQLAGSEMFPAWSIGQQSPIFDALRDSELASAAEATPVAGGSAKSTYLTILYGMIMPHMRSPSDVHPGASKIEGVVTFSIDGRGNLGDRRIRRSSGFHDLDSAALAALAEAAPFPPPPHGLPIKLTFTYGAN